MPKEPVAVIINDVEYLLCSDDSRAHILNVAARLNQKLDEVKKHAPHYSDSKMMALAALQLADELLKLEGDYARLLTASDAFSDAADSDYQEEDLLKTTKYCRESPK